MKKYWLSFIFCLGCFSSIAALTAEFRVAAFYPKSEKFRHLYGDVTPNYQFEVGVPVCGCLEGFANLDWVCRSQRSDKCCRSDAAIVNGSFGLKCVSCVCDRYRLYLGLGACLGGINLSNRSCCTHEKVSKFVAGGIFKSGVLIDLFCKSYVDLFVDYLYQPVRFRSTVDIGGLKIGAGAGWKF